MFPLIWSMLHLQAAARQFLKPSTGSIGAKFMFNLFISCLVLTAAQGRSENDA
jgi:hypothetical protein